MRTDAKDPELVEHEGITEWQARHPNAQVSFQEAPAPFSVPERARAHAPRQHQRHLRLGQRRRAR